MKSVVEGERVTMEKYDAVHAIFVLVPIDKSEIQDQGGI
jgi:hypothetical protein